MTPTLDHRQKLAALKKAIIYARVSTDEQAKGYSLQTQLDACRRYAIERTYTIAAEFQDDISGASMDRPGLNELREFIATGTTHVVIVYDVDRLARKSIYQMLIEEEFCRAGAVAEYVLGQYADSDEGRLQKQIRASIAEYEKAKIMERSKRGKRGKAKSGYVLVGSRPPYGYQVQSEPHKSWLVVDEDEGKIVRLVFEWYLHGDGENGPMSIRGIATRLTAMGIPTRGDKSQHVHKKQATAIWQSAMISHILKNETYTGIWHFGKTKMISDGKELTRKEKPKCGLGKQVTRAREDWIAVPVPALISRSAFDIVQKRLKNNKQQARRNENREYLMARRLRCTVCGYACVAMTRHEKHRYYRCNGAWQRPKVCHMPNFRVDLVDNAIWAWLKDMLEHPKQLAAGLRGSQADSVRANKSLQDRLNLIEQQISRTNDQLNKLLDLYLSTDFPKELLAERKSRLEQTLADLAKEQTDITSHLHTELITDEQIAEIEEFCAEIREGLEHATFEDKRKYIDLLDLRGKLAIENDQKVVYVRCLIGQQQVSVVPTSPSSNTGATAIINCGSPLPIRSP